MPLDRDERIRQRAYEIWEREGRPHGRDEEHWRMAAEEIGGESGASVTQAVPATRVSGTAKPGGESSVEAQPSKPAAETAEQARPAPQADPLGLAQSSNDNPARRGGAKPRDGAPRKAGNPAPGGPGRPH